jgi:HEAT repeats/Putative zinc-finger
MNHEQYREKLPLLVYNELEKAEARQLRIHIDQCARCTEELRQLEKLQSTVDTAALPKVSEELLNEARMELRAALRMERSRKSWKDLWTERVQGWLPIMRLSFATMASLAIGILIGYKALQPEVVIQQPEKRVADVPSGIEKSNMQITNVKFADADAADGEVEFTFEAVTPMKYKGSINNPNAQKVLTYALVNEQNPGIRLHAVNALNAKELHKPDPLVKQALIKALKSDENPGVRMEALTALQKFEADEQIKDAFVNALVNDKSPGIRIAAIKGVESERLVDQDVVNVLKKMRTDENEFVRLNAIRLTQEVSEKQ